MLCQNIDEETLKAENNRLIQRLSTFEQENLKEALLDLEEYKRVQAIIKTRPVNYPAFKRFSVNSRTRSRIVLLLGGKCKKCGSKYKLDIHHTTPRNEGGTNEYQNLELLCRVCHDRAHGIMKRYGILLRAIL